MSYRIGYLKLDGSYILSSYCFATRDEAERFQDYIFGNHRDVARIIETADEPNSEFKEHIVWKPKATE